MRALLTYYGDQIWREYGFVSAINVDEDWVSSDHIGIDQGVMVAMLENHRSGLVWRVMRNNPHLRRGLERAGFSGGWLGPGR